MLPLPFHNESYLDYFFVFNNVVFQCGGTPCNVDTLYIFYCLGSFFQHSLDHELSAKTELLKVIEESKERVLSHVFITVGLVVD
jgi:hypothetical protein